MIPAIQRGCAAARASLFSPTALRAFSFKPFAPPAKMPLWGRRATFIPFDTRVPISIGGKWGAQTRRAFGNEENAGVVFHKEESVKTREITVQNIKGSDWNAKADLLVDLRRGKYHVIEFPKGALEGEAGWAEEMIRMLSKGKHLNLYARFGSGAGEEVHKNPDAKRMQEIERDAGERDLVIHSLDVSKEESRKAAAQFLDALSAKSTIRLTFY